MFVRASNLDHQHEAQTLVHHALQLGPLLLVQSIFKMQIGLNELSFLNQIPHAKCQSILTGRCVKDRGLQDLPQRQDNTQDKILQFPLRATLKSTVYHLHPLPGYSAYSSRFGAWLSVVTSAPPCTPAADTLSQVLVNRLYPVNSWNTR